MFTTTILMVALMGQAPEATTRVQGDAMGVGRELPGVGRDLGGDPGRRPTQKERIAARKAALRRQNAMREQAEYVAAQREQARAAAEYRAMLPFMLEQQRQAIQRQGDWERNQALDRIAGAAESEARTYEANSYYRRRP